MGTGAFLSRGRRFVLRRCLLALWAIDLLLIAVFSLAWLIARTDSTRTMPFLVDITKDWSIPTSFAFLKWAVTIALLAVLFVRTKLLLFLVLGIAFALILADDALQLHERWGGAIARDWKSLERLGLRGQDVGELLIFGLLGVAVAVLLYIGVRASSGTASQVARWFVT